MMIMKMGETAVVLSLLNSDLRPIEEVLAEFNSKFPRSRYLTVCSSLSLLLQDPMVLPGTDRLIGFAIIYQCYSSNKPSANPFVSDMINAACNEQVDKYERAFLLHLLQWNNYNNAKEILKQSAVDYIKSFDPSTHDFPELGELQREYGKANPGPSSHIFADNALKKLLHDPDVPRGCDPNSPEFDVQPGGNSKIGSGDRNEALSGILGSLTTGGLTPRWIRPCPPRYPVHQSEVPSPCPPRYPVHQSEQNPSRRRMQPPFNSFQPQARPHQHQHQQHQQQQQNNGYPGYQQHNGYQNPALMNPQMMSNPMMAGGHMNNMVPLPSMNPQFFNNMPQQQQQFPQFGLQNNINQLLNLMAQSLPLQPNFFQPLPSAFPPQPQQPPQFNSFNPPRRPYLPVPTPLQNHQPPPGFPQPRPQLPQGQSVEIPNNNNNGFRNNYTKQQKFNGQGQGFQRPHLHQSDNAKKKFGSKKDDTGKGKNNKKAPGLHGSDATEKKRPLAISYTKKEVRQWREARRKNFPTKLNVEKSLKKNVSGCVLDKEARMRRKQIQEVLAKQAELGVEVAEVPSHYLSNTDEQVNGDRGGRFQNNRNHKRRHGGKDRFSKKPRVQNESSSQESSITTREPTLLEKLLSADIKREKSQLLQVFRFMVINSCFKELPEQPLKLPLVMVE